MFSKVIEDALFETFTRFEIPIYIIQGEYDYQVSYQLAKAYLDSIDAPQKEFFTFEESAHSPNLSSVKLMRSLGMKKNEMFENKLLCKGRLSVEHKYFRIKNDK